MKVLGIESSCDETAASVVEDGRVLSDVVASQVKVHRPYGGVVPELASRNHMIDIVPVIREALLRAGAGIGDLDGIAATAGPGLVGSLVVGLQVAKTIAAARGLPFAGVNHLRGHLLAARIGEGRGGGISGVPDFPYVALLASGGHTGIYLVSSEDRISCLGQTRDDAAGEAFDKVAKLLGLGYPGGPVIDRMAAGGDPGEVFPQALRQRRSYEFSFSGIKTAVAQRVAALGGAVGEDRKLSIVRGFQRAVVEIMVRKVVLAAREKQIPRVVLAGGVAANGGLRARAAAACAENDLELFAPHPSRCTDNGAMIAYAGWLALASGRRDTLDLAPRAGWPL
jgi:N6-L-threonylcarbamoyladenine synthase